MAEGAGVAVAAGVAVRDGDAVGCGVLVEDAALVGVTCAVAGDAVADRAGVGPDRARAVDRVGVGEPVAARCGPNCTWVASATRKIAATT